MVPSCDKKQVNMEGWLSPSKKVFKSFEKISKNKHVKDFRVIGAIGVLEMHDKVNVKSLQKKCVDNGIWLRPYSKLIYIMPPYCILKKELKYSYKIIYQGLKKLDETRSHN